MSGPSQWSLKHGRAFVCVCRARARVCVRQTARTAPNFRVVWSIIIASSDAESRLVVVHGSMQFCVCRVALWWWPGAFATSAWCLLTGRGGGVLHGC